MNSMTGYGKATVECDGVSLTVELKSVNHRFLDISTKIPRAFLQYEDLVRSVLTEKVSRGHIDVYVNYNLLDSADKTVTVNLPLAADYVRAVDKLRNEFPQLHDDFTINSLMRCADVLCVEQKAEEDKFRGILREALTCAADQLNEMREVEGNKLRTDILAKIDTVEKLLQTVKTEAPAIVQNYREKLRLRVQSALDDVAIDESKLANEVCFFADKSCIDEEITRLETHIAHAREILASEEPVGRKMDFLVQEFNRETNTICSKSNSIDLTNVALEMKNEIEKIREQIQNLE